MRILMIGAHPDDAEFEGGGLTALYRERGHEVAFLSVCNGSRGHHEMTPEETAERRWGETRRVEAFLGIRYDVWRDSDDCELEATLSNRRRMIRYIRAYAPDLIITHRTNDYHADHRAVALLVQDSAYMLTVPHECPDVPYMKFMPVILYFDDSFQNPPLEPAVAVDIGPVIDKKLAMIELNESQIFEWLPFNDGGDSMPPPKSEPEARHAWFLGPEVTEDTTDEELAALCDTIASSQSSPDEIHSAYRIGFALGAMRRRDFLRRYFGEERGSRVRYAEVFGVSEYGSPLTEEKRKQLFPFD